MEKDPTEVIRKAVLRMLPRNRLRDVSETLFLFYSVIAKAWAYLFLWVITYVISSIIFCCLTLQWLLLSCICEQFGPL